MFVGQAFFSPADLGNTSFENVFGLSQKIARNNRNDFGTWLLGFPTDSLSPLSDMYQVIEISVEAAYPFILTYDLAFIINIPFPMII